MYRCRFWWDHVRQFRRDVAGAVAVEYAFVIAFIAIVSAIGMVAMGNSLSSFFGIVGTSMNEVACEMLARASEQGKKNSNRCNDKP